MRSADADRVRDARITIAVVLALSATKPVGAGLEAVLRASVDAQEQVLSVCAPLPAAEPDE